MSRLFYHVMQDNLGNLLFDVTGTMRLAGTGTAATIYGDAALTVPLPNPMTNHPSFGSFKCYLGAGSYDFYMAKGGYTFETLTGVQGHGTMALQNANAVAITGGSITGATVDFAAYLGVTGNALVGGTMQVNGTVGLGTAPETSRLTLRYLRSVQNGLALKPDADTGAAALYFMNAASAAVGTITTSATATAYNTSSDPRLKEAVQALEDALAVVQALRPVQFQWKADGSVGHGFLATEVQQVVPEAVTGDPEAVDADGQIVPMGMDASKLMPWVIGALQALVLRVEAFEARLA